MNKLQGIDLPWIIIDECEVIPVEVFVTKPVFERIHKVEKWTYISCSFIYERKNTLTLKQFKKRLK